MKLLATVLLSSTFLLGALNSVDNLNRKYSFVDINTNEKDSVTDILADVKFWQDKGQYTRRAAYAFFIETVEQATKEEASILTDYMVHIRARKLRKQSRATRVRNKQSRAWAKIKLNTSKAYEWLLDSVLD